MNVTKITGTSSLRRTAQISRFYPHLQVHDIRGNLNTRLAKLDAVDSKYAGIILAQAGIVRLGWQNRISQTIEPNEILYAVGQGALAVECRSSDTKILSMLQKLVCHETQCRILAERSFLKTLGGGCSAPVAVHSTITKRSDAENEIDRRKREYELHIIGSVWSLDGKTEIQTENSCNLDLCLQDDYDDDEVPAKRMKLSIDVTDDKELSIENPSPPQIIDHSQFIANENLDIAGILNVHKDAFKMCPYSSVLQTNKLTESDASAHAMNTNATSLKCPLNFAIGQDVMGQCPYFDSAKGNEPLADVSRSSCGQCPYKNGCASDKSEAKKCAANECAKPDLDIKKCPFLSSTPSSSKNLNTSTVEDLSNENIIEPLFCGLYPHRCWPLDVFEKCEQLGKDLASKLIEKGALSVMECAQNEIRNK